MAEGKSVALAAVIVSGVVGVCAPIIAWRAGLDSQHAAAREERARADLTELRSVLDTALIDLSHEYILVTELQKRTNGNSNIPLERTDMIRQINEAGDKTLTDQDRLRIRLGGDSAVARFSTTTQRLLQLRYVVEGPWNASIWSQSVRLSNSVYAALRSFEQEANRLAGSQLH